MTADHLSRILDLVEAQGAVTGGFIVTGTWTTHTPIVTPLKLIAMIRGRGRVRTDGVDGDTVMHAGDVAVLNNRQWITMTSDPAVSPVEVQPERGFAFATRPQTPDSDVVIGGHVELNREGRELLRHALPPLGVVRAAQSTAHPIPDLFERLLGEVQGRRPGSEFAARSYAHLVVLEVLRTSLQHNMPPGSWLSLIADEQLRPAVRLIHESPGQPWRLRELSEATGMSRTAFITRFRSVAGVPPLQYLTQWRMRLAQHALRATAVSISSLADQLGYGTAAAFSTAFKRETNLSPQEYRTNTVEV